MLKILGLLVVAAGLSFAQTNVSVQMVTVAPTGSCNNQALMQQVVGAGLYQCVGGTWTAVGSGSYTGGCASNPCPVNGGGTGAATAAAALANLNGVSTVQTAAQQIASALLVPNLNSVISVDATPSTNASFIGTYSGTTIYLPGNVVTYSGSNYIKTSTSGAGTSPATADGTNWWPYGPSGTTVNTAASPCVTNVDVAAALAIGAWKASGNKQMLDFGIAGPYITCGSLNLGSATQIPFSVQGKINTWAGGGIRQPGTTIRAATGTGVPVFYHGAPSGNGGAATLQITNVLADANSQNACWILNGLEAPVFQHLGCLNANNATHWFTFGDYANPNPGSQYNADSDLLADDIVVAGSQNQASSNAVLTVTGSTATITLVSGGTYQNPSPIITFLGFCTTKPVYTANMTGTGPYTMASVTTVSAGVGCNTSNEYAIAPDLASTQYCGDMLAIDSRIDNLKIWGCGQIANLRTGGADFQLYYYHPVGGVVQVYDTGGALLANPYFDSPAGFGADIKSNTRIDNAEFYWNSGTGYKGASGYLFDSNSYGAQVTNSTCGNQQTSGGYTLFANTSGPLNLAFGNPYSVIPSGVLYGKNQSCDGTYSVYSNLNGTIFSGNVTATVPSTPGTVTVTSNGGSVTSFTYCVVAINSDQTASARNCGTQNTGSVSGVPNATISWVASTGNANGYAITCAAGCTSTGTVAIVNGATLAYTDTTGTPITSNLTAGNPTGGRLAMANGSSGYGAFGLNAAGTQIQASPQNGTPDGFAITIANGSINTTGLSQNAASNFGGTCAMSSSTSCTITIAHTYTTPVCIATQQSATLTGAAVGCTVSGTTVTVTAAVSNSETWGAIVFGNPN